MESTEKKKIIKFLNKVSNINPDVQFLSRGNEVGCDISDSDRVGSLLELNVPKGYYIDIESGRKGIIKKTGLIKKIICYITLANFEKEDFNSRDIWAPYNTNEEQIVGPIYGMVSETYSKPVTTNEKKPGLFSRIKDSLKYRFSKRAEVKIEEPSKKKPEPEFKPIKRPVVETIPSVEKKVETIPSTETVENKIEEAINSIVVEKPVVEEITSDRLIEALNVPAKEEPVTPISLDHIFDDNRVENIPKEDLDDNLENEEFEEFIKPLTLKEKLKKLKDFYQSSKRMIGINYYYLGKIEKEFVDDAIAENLVYSDDEFQQMMDERTLDKDSVWFYMGIYTGNMSIMEEMVEEYSKLTKTERDYSYYTINRLRKLAAENKRMLTGAELEKHKLSKLTKKELIDILTRIDEKKHKQEVIKILNMR